MPGDDKLGLLLNQAKTTPFNFALITAGTHCKKLILKKRPISSGEISKAKKEVKGKASWKGVCKAVSGTEMLFQIGGSKEPSTTAKKLRDFISDEAGITIKPVLQLVADLAEIDEDALNGDYMDVKVELEGTAKTLNKRNGSRLDLVPGDREG